MISIKGSKSNLEMEKIDQNLGKIVHFLSLGEF